MCTNCFYHRKCTVVAAYNLCCKDSIYSIGNIFQALLLQVYHCATMEHILKCTSGHYIIIGDVLLQTISLICYHGGTHCTIVKMQQKLHKFATCVS